MLSHELPNPNIPGRVEHKIGGVLGRIIRTPGGGSTKFLPSRVMYSAGDASLLIPLEGVACM